MGANQRSKRKLTNGHISVVSVEIQDQELPSGLGVVLVVVFLRGKRLAPKVGVAGRRCQPARQTKKELPSQSGLVQYLINLLVDSVGSVNNTTVAHALYFLPPTSVMD